MHCYSGNALYAKKFVERGLHLGIGGPVTFKTARELQEIVQFTDLSNLLVETDDPYLAPEPFRGKRNQADYVTYVIERIALIKGMATSTVAQVTTTNATLLFGGER